MEIQIAKSNYVFQHKHTYCRMGFNIYSTQINWLCFMYHLTKGNCRNTKATKYTNFVFELFLETKNNKVQGYHPRITECRQIPTLR